MKMFFANRYHQSAAIIISVSMITAIGILGFYAYQQSPHFYLDQSLPFSTSNINITTFENQPVSHTFHYRLPEFMFRKDENEWWRRFPFTNQ